MERIAVTSRLEFRGSDIAMPMVGYSGFDAFSRPLGLGTHTHEGHELTYVFEGQVRWEVSSGEVLTLAGGDMAITQPHVAHRGYCNIIQPAAIFWLNVEFSRGNAAKGTPFSRDNIARMSAAWCGAGNATRFTGGVLHADLVRLHDTLRAARSAGRAGRLAPGKQALLRSLISLTVARVSELLAEGGTDRPVDSHAREACDYIARHLEERFSADTVARHVGVSVSRLHAVFKQRMGVTPMDYAQRLRVERAQEILRNNSTPVTEIALSLGFSSSQYFATCFRKYTGMSPREYRVRG
jgi:AraC-like DNA-binding protein